jgi:hypothetical protein
MSYSTTVFDPVPSVACDIEWFFIAFESHTEPRT